MTPSQVSNQRCPAAQIPFFHHYVCLESHLSFFNATDTGVLSKIGSLSASNHGSIGAPGTPIGADINSTTNTPSQAGTGTHTTMPASPYSDTSKTLSTQPQLQGENIRVE